MSFLHPAELGALQPKPKPTTNDAIQTFTTSRWYLLRNADTLRDTLFVQTFNVTPRYATSTNSVSVTGIQ